MKNERIRPQTDTTLFWLALAASVLGLVFILDAGYAQSAKIGAGLLPRAFFTQIFMLSAGVVCFFVIRKVKSDKLQKLAPWIMGLAFISLVLVEIVGISQNGAKRWLGTASMSVQPAELMKVAAILYLAYALAKKKPWQSTWEKRRKEKGWVKQVLVPKLERLWPAFIILAAMAFVEHEKDLGTACVILATSCALFFTAPVTSKSVAIVGLILLVGLGAFVAKEPYRVKRFLVHPHRWEREYINDETYQPINSELAMVSGKLVGVGFGSGRAKYLLPATTSDYIMATVGEECGFWGPAICLLLVGGISFKLLVTAKQTKDRFKVLFLSGTAWWIAIQACTNLMMANATLPSIGIPFPFISAGGSSLIAIWIALGVCDRFSTAHDLVQKPSKISTEGIPLKIRRKISKPRVLGR
jgi:cell division protein FtsW